MRVLSDPAPSLINVFSVLYNSMLRVFPKSENERIVCFEVTNFEVVADIDPEREGRLESALAEGGALVARLDYPSKTLCVCITDPNVSASDVMLIISSFGYEVRPQKEKDNGEPSSKRLS